MSEKVQKVDVDLLEIKDHLSRTKLDISSLVESLELTGQINPIVVKPVGNKYRVIAGRRRTTALKTLQAMTGKKQKALIVIKELDDLQEELVTIDENIVRKQLTDAEFDEAIYRRKQIYEQLHPETKQHVAGGKAKHAKDEKPAFTKDAAKKLGVTSKSVERAVARAGKATDAVKKARAEGEISQSKVDFLITLPGEDQNILLPLIKKKDVSETKKIVERARKIGGKATILYLKEEEGEEEELAELKMLTKEALRLAELIDESLKKRRVFRSKNKFEIIRSLEALTAKLFKFTDFQRASLGARVAIRRRKSEEKVIHATT